MRWLKTFLMLLAPLIFGLSIYWGTRAARETDLEDGALKAIPPLEILTYRGLLPREIIKDFERRTRIPVVLHEVSSSEDLWANFSEGNLSFDLVTLASFQFRAAIESGRLERLETSKLDGWSRVSADFKGPWPLRSDRKLPREHHLMPLVWGIVGRWSKRGASDKDELLSGHWSELWASHAQGAFNPLDSGKWKFEPSESFAPLLVISMGISDSSPKSTEVYAFLNHLLRRESVEAMRRSFREASAIRTGKATTPESARLEPEFLRTFPLPRIQVDYEGKNAQRMKNYLNSKFRLKNFAWPPPAGAKDKAATKAAPDSKITVDPSAGP